MNISEMAIRTGLTPRAIRYYESKGLIRPGKNDRNGYREYGQQDVWRLQTIAALRELDVPVECISAMLRSIDRDDPGEVRRYLELQRDAWYMKLAEAKAMLDTLERLLGDAPAGSEYERLPELTSSLKEAREIRRSWSDRWDFGKRAEQLERGVWLPAGLDRTMADTYGRTIRTTAEWVRPRPDETGLDLGAGTGALSGALLRAGAGKLMALEQSEEMAACFRRNCGGVEVRIGNALAMPFMDGTFDYVASTFALPYLDERQQQAALAELDRVLKPDGSRLALAGPWAETEEERDGAPDDARGEYAPLRPRWNEWLRKRGYRTAYVPIAGRIGLLFAYKARV
ncbi:methyltransferase domain-containing protein [Paenibacillus thermoaerophilus]|uniref:Methyltransferase domain-containing protein n=1 Tax=Paenibacillus thermoaerophilus TaxID=1215385 RepID=A0ABW2V959_9BACL|nr:MerR family transcriptional regulator [Paenibacillus thermoaerophilus]TMV17097.1 methyltransferase domain-containing protein [Paenibacillus thermoaerophilus]